MVSELWQEKGCHNKCRNIEESNPSTENFDLGLLYPPQEKPEKQSFPGATSENTPGIMLLFFVFF